MVHQRTLFSNNSLVTAQTLYRTFIASNSQMHNFGSLYENGKEFTFVSVSMEPHLPALPYKKILDPHFSRMTLILTDVSSVYLTDYFYHDTVEAGAPVSYCMILIFNAHTGSVLKMDEPRRGDEQGCDTASLKKET